jgi:hypothetical protein
MKFSIFQSSLKKSVEAMIIFGILVTSLQKKRKNRETIFERRLKEKKIGTRKRLVARFQSTLLPMTLR